MQTICEDRLQLVGRLYAWVVQRYKQKASAVDGSSPSPTTS